MTIGKAQFKQFAKQILAGSTMQVAEERAEQAARNKNGVEENLLLGFDPQLDELITEMNGHFAKGWGARAAIGKYLESKLEK